MITNLNAYAIASGIIDAKYLPASLTATVAGNGSNLTNLNAYAITSGIINAKYLPAFLTASGNGSNLTNLNAYAITSGIIDAKSLPSFLTTTWNGSNLTNLNAFSITSGIIDAQFLPPSLSAIIAGNGSALTNINASSITSGVINVQCITNINASSITSGKIGAQFLPTSLTASNVAIGKVLSSYALDVSGTINATYFIGDGSMLTAVNVTSNFAWTGSNLGIGKPASAAYALDVSGGVKVSGSLFASNINFTGALTQNGVPYIGSQWSLNDGIALNGSNVIDVQRTNLTRTPTYLITVGNYQGLNNG